MKSLSEYHNLYLKMDVLLLANVFGTFRKTYLNNYPLDPAHFYTSPGLAWQGCLKMTGIRLELLTDPDMLLMFERGTRGGITQAVHRYAWANNKYIVSVKLLTRLQLGFTHLREHKFRHNVSNSSRCICGDGEETTEHFLLRCHHFVNIRSTLLEQMSYILKTGIKVLPEHRLVEILLYGDNNCNEIANKLIIEAAIVFIKLSKHFDTKDC